MSKPQILITTSTFCEYDETPVMLIDRNGLAAKKNPFGRKLTRDEVIDLGSDKIGIIAGTEPLDRTVLEKLPSLKVLSRCGVGMDNVDLEAARELGIKVFNTPDGPTLAVAELAIGIIISLLRKVNQMDKAIRDGVWKKQMGNLLNGKKVGVIGFGRIGQKVAELLMPFGVELAYCDLQVKECSLECHPKRIDEIFAWADIITLHLSPAAGCAALVGRKELGLMRKGSWLVNFSRGGTVDEEALFDALKGGHLAGAALDVFEKEPYEGPLKEFNNVILTPHIGSYAREARVRMEMQSVENLLKGLKEAEVIR